MFLFAFNATKKQQNTSTTVFSKQLLRFMTGILVLITGTLMLSINAQAHEYKVGDIEIIHPYARATMPQQTNGASYFNLKNTGQRDDKLIGIESTIAKTVEIHTMEMNGDIMKMRNVSEIVIKANNAITMKPGGGSHIMLIGLSKPLKAGDTFPLELEFERAGKLEVMVRIEATPIDGAMTEHSH